MTEGARPGVHCNSGATKDQAGVDPPQPRLQLPGGGGGGIKAKGICRLVLPSAHTDLSFLETICPHCLFRKSSFTGCEGGGGWSKALRCCCSMGWGWRGRLFPNPRLVYLTPPLKSCTTQW